MNISIGILAYNESLVISQTLQSLFQQSLFSQPDPREVIQIVVVPNGCTDETAAVARATLEELVFAHPGVRWQVCEVAQPGKSNAWNYYIHEFSDPAADYFILMDADIQFLEPHTLRHMIDTLEAMPQAWVSVDKPVKDVALKEQKSLMERLSVSVSGLSGDSTPWICGQLYCARAAVLRGIWMPTGIQVEDGFLWTMVVTNRLTSTEVLDRVVLARSASHVFEAYTDLNRLLDHERRQVVGNTINLFLYSYLSANCNPDQDASSLIKHRNAQDAHWLSQLIQANVSEKGWWIIPRSFLFRRFQRLRYQRLQQAILMFPVAFMAFWVDVLVCFQANFELHRRGSIKIHH